MRRALVIAVVAACGRAAPAPSTGSIPVLVDGVRIAEVAGPVDLWTLCPAGERGVTIFARAASSGSYVSGRCDQRGGYAFALAGGTARLASTFDGAPSTLAHADHVLSIDLVHAADAATAPAPATLTITVGGESPIVVTAAQLDAGAADQHQHHRAGVTVAAVMAAAHVAVPATGRIVAIGADDERYEVAAAALTDPAQSVLVRHTNQGLVRLDHVDAAGKAMHVRGVRALDIER